MLSGTLGDTRIAPRVGLQITYLFRMRSFLFDFSTFVLTFLIIFWNWLSEDTESEDNDKGSRLCVRQSCCEDGGKVYRLAVRVADR